MVRSELTPNTGALDNRRRWKMERRPLASRNWRFSILLAGWLARRGVTPNAISLLGMGAGVIAGLTFWLTSRGGIAPLRWLLGAGLVQFRLLCNLIDGMVAIEAGKGSPMGEVYNEIPDRVSDVATLIGLGYAAGGSPAWGFLAAILAVFVAYVRAAVKVAGAPRRLFRPDGKAASDVRRDRDGTALRTRAHIRAKRMARPGVGLARDRARVDCSGLRVHGHAQAAPCCPLPESENGMSARHGNGCSTSATHSMSRSWCLSQEFSRSCSSSRPLSFLVSTGPVG